MQGLPPPPPQPKQAYTCQQRLARCSGPETAGLKATRLDRYSTRDATLSACGFFIGVVILMIIGGTGPAIYSGQLYAMSAPCSATAPCIASMNLSLTDLNPWKQVVYVAGRMARPVTNTVFDQQVVSYSQNWQVDVLDASGKAVVSNVSHASPVTCPALSDASGTAPPLGPGQEVGYCSFFLVFAQPLLTSPSYYISLRFLDPLVAFRTVAGTPPGVVFSFRQGSINEKYTEFEAGFKITFCVITILLVTFYFWSLSCGPYNKGPDDVTPLRSTPFQIWIAVLSVLLFFFDDPGFIIYTFSPTVASAGFTAFCTATFVASLLFFFLCIADNARIEGEAGLQWRFKLLQPRGVLYWAPKIIICSVLWATTLSLYALQRLAQLEDPTFSFTETVGTDLVLFAQRFMIGIGSLYTIYFAILLVLAFHRFHSMTPSTRYLLAVSITTLVLVLAGLFAGGFNAQLAATMAFLLAYGLPNIYLWSLMILFRPGPAPEAWATDTRGVLGGAGSDPVAAADAALEISSPAAWAALSPDAQYAALCALQGRLRQQHQGADSDSGAGRTKSMFVRSVPSQQAQQQAAQMPGSSLDGVIVFEGADGHSGADNGYSARGGAGGGGGDASLPGGAGEHQPDNVEAEAEHTGPWK